MTKDEYQNAVIERLKQGPVLNRDLIDNLTGVFDGDAEQWLRELEDVGMISIDASGLVSRA